MPGGGASLNPTIGIWAGRAARSHPAGGVAGLGGAVFPTHSKLDGRGQLTEILIVNGLECEPYITPQMIV